MGSASRTNPHPPQITRTPTPPTRGTEKHAVLDKDSHKDTYRLPGRRLAAGFLFPMFFFFSLYAVFLSTLWVLSAPSLPSPCPIFPLSAVFVLSLLYLLFHCPLSDSGVCSLGSGLWTLVSGLWTLGSGLWALGFGLWASVSGLWVLVSVL